MSRQFFQLGLVIVACCVAAPVQAQSNPEIYEQEPPAESQRRFRKKQQNAERIQERIDDLREQGYAEDSPEITRLSKLKNRIESRRNKGFGKRKGATSDSATRPSKRVPPDRIKSFLDEHPDLLTLFSTRPDGSRVPQEQVIKNVQHASDELSKIIIAYDEGKVEVADLMLDLAKTQIKLRHKVWMLHHADPDQQQILRSEIKTLVHSQINRELSLQEYKIEELRTRLREQEQRLQADRQRQDDLVQSKLTRLMKKKKNRRSKQNRRQQTQSSTSSATPDTP